jgi:hypothetical protein
MIKVSSFLDKTEIAEVESALREPKIEYFISSKGSASGRYHDPFYQVSVNATDYILTRRIVSRILAKSLIENQKCPKCKTLGYKVIEKKNWIERLYYLGTTRVQCRKCKNKYVI